MGRLGEEQGLGGRAGRLPNFPHGNKKTGFAKKRLSILKKEAAVAVEIGRREG